MAALLAANELSGPTSAVDPSAAPAALHEKEQRSCAEDTVCVQPNAALSAEARSTATPGEPLEPNDEEIAELAAVASATSTDPPADPPVEQSASELPKIQSSSPVCRIPMEMSLEALKVEPTQRTPEQEALVLEWARTTRMRIHGMPVEHLAQKMRVETFDTPAEIFHQGDVTDESSCYYIVFSGAVEIWREQHAVHSPLKIHDGRASPDGDEEVPPILQSTTTDCVCKAPIRCGLVSICLVPAPQVRRLRELLDLYGHSAYENHMHLHHHRKTKGSSDKSVADGYETLHSPSPLKRERCASPSQGFSESSMRPTGPSQALPPPFMAEAGKGGMGQGNSSVRGFIGAENEDFVAEHCVWVASAGDAFGKTVSFEPSHSPTHARTELQRALWDQPPEDHSGFVMGTVQFRIGGGLAGRGPVLD